VRYDPELLSVMTALDPAIRHKDAGRYVSKHLKHLPKDAKRRRALLEWLDTYYFEQTNAGALERRYEKLLSKYDLSSDGNDHLPPLLQTR
jgi:hypothetical protein